MIRIDEIYYNVFTSALQHHPRIALHWFDPFGSKCFKDLVTYPCIEHGHRILFWDQEPLYKDDARIFFDKFCATYRPPRDPAHHTTVTLVTSELNSLAVKWVQDTYKIEHTAHYFFHGWAALDWYRGYNHSFLSQSWPERKFDHAIICLNNIVGGQRAHRLQLLSELGKRECINQNLISFPDVCPYEGKSVEELFQKNALIFPKNLSLPLIVDHNHNHASNSHRINFWAQAMRCFCHVVTETVYDDQRIHITEKTFKPIVLQQPFLLIGNRGALGYLRSYGFQTFGNIWDEGYDELDYEHRIGAVADICQDITSWSPQRMRQAQKEITDVVQHNHDWFYGGFQDVLWKETCEMVDRWR